MVLLQNERGEEFFLVGRLFLLMQEVHNFPSDIVLEQCESPGYSEFTLRASWGIVIESDNGWDYFVRSQSIPFHLPYGFHSIYTMQSSIVTWMIGILVFAQCSI